MQTSKNVQEKDLLQKDKNQAIDCIWKVDLTSGSDKWSK